MMNSEHQAIENIYYSARQQFDNLLAKKYYSDSLALGQHSTDWQ